MGKQSNPAFTALIVVGILALAAGAVTWVVAAQQVTWSEKVISLTGTSSGLGAAQASVWVGIVLTVLGAVLLVAALIIAAARRPAPVA